VLKAVETRGFRSYKFDYSQRSRHHVCTRLHWRQI